MQTEDSQQVIKRFFEALQVLIDRREIRGKQTFTNRYDINRWNMNHLQKHLESDIFQPAWLTYLVRDYHISAVWLLTGVGEPLPPLPKEEPKPKRPVGRPRKNAES